VPCGAIWPLGVEKYAPLTGWKVYGGYRNRQAFADQIAPLQGINVRLISNGEELRGNWMTSFAAAAALLWMFLPVLKMRDDPFTSSQAVQISAISLIRNRILEKLDKP
jgi:hypothetical protein